MADHHSEAASALNPTVNAQDTTVLFQRPEGDYLLVAATSARTAARSLIDAVAKRSEQAAPLHERARRHWQIARTVRIISIIIAMVGAAAVAWHLMWASLGGLVIPAAVAAIVGVIGYVFIGGFALEGLGDSASGRAAQIELAPAVELLGGIYLPTPGGLEIRSRHPVPDGSLLLRLEGESRHLRRAAESLTGEQRDQILALVKNDLIGEAVTELSTIGLVEAERRTQEALREARGERATGKRPLLRVLLGRG